MKRLLSQPITRQRRSIGDYIKAADQDTLDGLRDFAARQEQRRSAAQIAAVADRREREQNLASVQSIFEMRRKGLKV